MMITNKNLCSGIILSLTTYRDITKRNARISGSCRLGMKTYVMILLEIHKLRQFFYSKIEMLSGMKDFTVNSICSSAYFFLSCKV
jgi:hypothetical protein